MVRRILIKTKHETRRLPGPRNCLVDGSGVTKWPELDLSKAAAVSKGASPNSEPWLSYVTPDECWHRISSRIQPGDGVWFREVWSPDHAAFYPHTPIVYRADGLVLDDFGDGQKDGCIYSPEDKRRHPFRWRSPLFMPRAACRARAIVTSVGVERLGDIDEEGIRAEGADTVTLDELLEMGASKRKTPTDVQMMFAPLAGRWRLGWTALHGAYDPAQWVLVIRFTNSIQGDIR